MSFYEHSKKNWLFSSLWKNAQKPDFLNLSKIVKPYSIDLGIFFNGFRICFFRKKYFQTDCDLEKKWPFDSLRQPILRSNRSVRTNWTDLTNESIRTNRSDKTNLSVPINRTLQILKIWSFNWKKRTILKIV